MAPDPEAQSRLIMAAVFGPSQIEPVGRDELSLTHGPEQLTTHRQDRLRRRVASRSTFVLALGSVVRFAGSPDGSSRVVGGGNVRHGLVDSLARPAVFIGRQSISPAGHA